jgi:outer membrane lipoprotein-sorting protein
MLAKLISVCLLCLLPIYGLAQEDAFTLESVLQRFTKAYGGFRDADALSSLSVEGTILQNGQTFDFLMRKKRPHSMRYRLSKESNSIITGYDGSQGWIRTKNNQEVSIDLLDQDARRKIRYQSRFDSPLFYHLQKREYQIELIEHTSLDERSVLVLEVIEYDSEASRYYLDLETAHIVRVDHLGADGELSIQTLYRDYREVEGFPFAFEIETRVNGETKSLAKVNSIDVNPGIFSVYFAMPKR